MFPREIIGSSDWLASLWDRRAALPSESVLLAWGMKVIAFRQKELRRWESVFPNAHTARYADCGHYIAEEKPAELAAAILALAP